MLPAKTTRSLWMHYSGKVSHAAAGYFVYYILYIIPMGKMLWMDTHLQTISAIPILKVRILPFNQLVQLKQCILCVCKIEGYFSSAYPTRRGKS